MFASSEGVIEIMELSYRMVSNISNRNRKITIRWNNSWNALHQGINSWIECTGNRWITVTLDWMDCNNYVQECNACSNTRIQIAVQRGWYIEISLQHLESGWLDTLSCNWVTFLWLSWIFVFTSQRIAYVEFKFINWSDLFWNWTSQDFFSGRIKMHWQVNDPNRSLIY